MRRGEVDAPLVASRQLTSHDEYGATILRRWTEPGVAIRVAKRTGL